jgi:hypothetical protein
MFKNFIYLISLVLILSTISITRADLVGWWKFDENAGKIAIDSSGNGHEGTLNGDTIWTFGQFNGALKFDGDGDYVTCGHIDIDTAVTGGLTVCAWINKPAGGDMKICSNRQVNSAAGGGFTCAIYNDRMEMDMCNATTRTLYRDNQGTILPGDTWMHLAWVYNDETDTYDEYHDGDLIASQTATTSIGISTAEFRIANDSPNTGHYFSGIIDDFRIYNHALDESEIIDAMMGRGPEVTRAVSPAPEDGLTDVSRDVFLSWTPGDFAAKHNVYLGTSFADVNSADSGSPLLVGPDIDVNIFDPGRLEFGETYYWRIDEINAPPETTVFKGHIWSFKVEPFVYPISSENIIATASSQAPGQGPENTINESGLDPNNTHSTTTTAMWLTDTGQAGPIWVQYEFDKVYKLDRMMVWNYNGQSVLSGFGLRDVTIEYSTDGTNWVQLDGAFEFSKASGMDGYASDITVDFNGIPVKSIKINPSSNWFPTFPQYGLSEIRFLYLPVHARGPDPDDGAADIAVDVTVSWRPGREAADHNVYVSTDQQALKDGTAPFITVTKALAPSGTGRIEYGPLSLDLDYTYYWRVDEVNNSEITTTWEGEIWSFSTQLYLVVDDFESYNDIELGDQGSHLIYSTWIDGYDNPSTNGSTIGYVTGYSLETDIVHGGRQSAPIFYDNSVASSSEVTVSLTELPIGRDWTVGSPDILTLWFYGDPNNDDSERMYVKLNGIKKVYNGDAGDIATPSWTRWDIELSSFGINLTNVTTITIGLERTGVTGGSGVIFVDDIRLYALLNN